MKPKNKIKNIDWGKKVAIYLKRLSTLLVPKGDILQEIVMQKMAMIKWEEENKKNATKNRNSQDQLNKSFEVAINQLKK